MRKKRPIERKSGVVRDAILVIIASEDRYAVKQYFEFFRSTRVQFRVLETQDGRSSPEHVMDRLDQYMKEFDFGQGDEFWFVSDTDHWIDPGHIANLTEVVRLCRQKGIGVALSNPCFDLWLLLHFADFPVEQEMTCAEVGKRIRETVGQYDKAKVFNLRINNASVASAISRSKANQPSTGEIPASTQTTVHQVVEHLVASRLIAIDE